MVVAFGPAARREGVLLLDALRQAGIRAVGDLLDRDARAQLRYADRVGARFALILGEGEIAAGVVTVRDMKTGAQSEVPRAEIAEAMRTRLAPGGREASTNGGGKG
jgi:histidyl-tRNA synthetase